MTISFLNPTFLFALAAGAIPILIHRLTQRKAVRRRFSAVRLLLQSQRRMAQPRRLKNLLLLALRVLTVISLATLMARPVLTRPGLLVEGDRGAKVLILDNSLSMGYQEAQGTRFDLARNMAREILEGLQTKVLVLPTVHPEGKPFGENDLTWMEPKDAIRKVLGLPLSFGRGDPASALRLAHHRLKEAGGIGEIIVLSDMVRGDWEGFTMNRLERVSAEVRHLFLRVGSSSRDPNLAIKGARIVRGETISGMGAILEVTVSNFSDDVANALLELYLSGSKKDQKSLGLKANEEGTVRFEFSLGQPGWVDLELRLSDDRLPLDNIFYLPIQVREKIRVLVVDGAPRTSPRQSESYYLTSALRPGNPEGSPFRVDVVPEDRAGSFDPKGFDVLFLLNVASPLSEVLSSFLEAGKPVFIFLGDSVNPEEYNRLPFFPWRIKELKQAVTVRGERIDGVDETFETLRLLVSTGRESLREASIHRYFRVEGGGKSLLVLSNRDPLLLQSAVRKGKLFLFVSSADMDWNDLPLNGAYLPLIQGLVKEAVAVGSKNPAVELWPGPVRKGEAPTIQIRGPQGGPGIYRAARTSDERRIGLNVSTEESDLQKLRDEEIREKFKPLGTRVIGSREGLRLGLHGSSKELWPYLLMFILFVIGLEMFLANKG